VLDRQLSGFRLIRNYTVPAESSAIIKHFLRCDSFVAIVYLFDGKGRPDHCARHAKIEARRTEVTSVLAVIER
jgi:hypothetical protein